MSEVCKTILSIVVLIALAAWGLRTGCINWEMLITAIGLVLICAAQQVLNILDIEGYHGGFRCIVHLASAGGCALVAFAVGMTAKGAAQ